MLINNIQTFEAPKWSREISRFLPIKPQFALWGNINDVFPIDIEGHIYTLRLTDYLRQVLANENYKTVVVYEPLIGFSLLYGQIDEYPAQFEAFSELTGENMIPNEPIIASLQKASEIIEKIVNNDKYAIAVILNFTSRMNEVCKSDVDEFYYKLFKLGLYASPKATVIREDTNKEIEQVEVILPFETRLDKDKEEETNTPVVRTMVKFNPVFWLLEKENDIPAWYAIDNPKIRVLPIPKPDSSIRQCVVRSLSPHISGYKDMTTDIQEKNMSVFIDQTNGMFAGEIVSIVQMAKKEDISFGQISEAITRYKLGIVENLWSKLDFKKIKNAEHELAKKVIGQEIAIQHTSDILKRSVYSLSGSQFSSHSQRPKGVLFFAGPTGVGKTELAKAITELIFGSATNYIRFDMSEFSHEQADQRLIGAPPGYVGYEGGGELTNAIKQNPFSVVLFDEIEKAHPKILDTFLQILDDGRLTSGRGETVYFSESLVIFTSNLGVFEQFPDGKRVQNITQDMEYPDISKKITESINDFFKYKLNRPEILNRIGKNIIVFDFIRTQTAYKIFDKMFNNMLFKLEDTHKIKLEISLEIKQKIINYVCSDLSMGGRGIGNNMEEILINPLSRALFDEEIQKGDNIMIYDINKINETWNIKLERIIP